MNNQPSIAVVLPRYGANLGGGAEALVRSLVLNVFCGNGLGGLSPSNIEIWSTCALDHRTWENALPRGVSQEDGLTVRRFPVDERNLECFIKSEIAMQEGRALSLEEQLDWLSSGVNSASLYKHIANAGSDFDLLIYAPYLFSTTFWGAMIHPEKSVLVPCLHNEHYAYLEVFRALFSRVRGLFFNTIEEQILAEKIYGSFSEKSFVVGMGFDAIENTTSIAPDQSQKSFLLYSGRKEAGKNLDLLIEYFSAYKEQYSSSNLELKIIGSGSIDFLNSLPDGVVDLGFVSEVEKLALMQSAVALCQPSVNESFSIVMMEAWLEKTAVIVHSECDVTRGHVERSGGGLMFSSVEEFCLVLKELEQSGKLSKELGLAGKAYVETEYSWPAVTERTKLAMQSLLTSNSNLQHVA